MFRTSGQCELLALALLFALVAGQSSNSTTVDGADHHMDYSMASLLIAVPSVVGLTIAACLVKNSLSNRGEGGAEDNERTFLYGTADSGQATSDSQAVPLDFTVAGNPPETSPQGRTSAATPATVVTSATSTFGSWFSFPAERPASEPLEEQKETSPVQKNVNTTPPPATSSWLPSFLAKKAAAGTSRKYYVDILRDEENSIMELTIATPMEDPDIEAAQAKKSSLMPVYREEVQYNLRI